MLSAQPIVQADDVSNKLPWHQHLLSNLNMLWGGGMAEVLSRLGVEHVVIAPGSRSAPMVVGFALHGKFKTKVWVDERSAAFYALGVAKSTGKPVVLVCTSGSAGAHFYPALIEAKMSGVPLIVMTADRPAVKREYHSRQTLDQQKLYGDWVRWYHELAEPQGTLKNFRYLREMMTQAWRKSTSPYPGPVHLNVPFSDPLHPELNEVEPAVIQAVTDQAFYSLVRPAKESVTIDGTWLRESLLSSERGVIILGAQQVAYPEVTRWVEQVQALSERLGWVVLTDGVGAGRYGQLSAQVARVEDILANHEVRDNLCPDWVVSIGSLPVGKVLRQWLSERDVQSVVVGDTDECITSELRRNIALTGGVGELLGLLRDGDPQPMGSYAQQWLDYEAKTEGGLETHNDSIAQAIREVTQWMPEDSVGLVNNSSAVRYLERFGAKRSCGSIIYGNRGANGIDGAIATVMGITAGAQRQGILITGDLGFLHDVASLAGVQTFQGALVVIILNNRGGRIFEKLPIAEYQEVFEEYFVTPQEGINIADLVKGYGATYFECSVGSLADSLGELKGKPGVHVVDVQISD